MLPYNRARVQGAQGLHQAEAKIGLPLGEYTQLKSATSATATSFMDSTTETERLSYRTQPKLNYVIYVCIKRYG